MKTAIELFAEFHTRTSYGLIFYEQNFIEALTEHDNEIKEKIKGMIEEQENFIENDSPTYEEISEAKAIIIALTELKQRLVAITPTHSSCDSSTEGGSQL